MNRPTWSIDPLGLFALDEDGFPVTPSGTALDTYIYDDDAIADHNEIMSNIICPLKDLRDGALATADGLIPISDPFADDFKLYDKNDPYLRTSLAWERVAGDALTLALFAAGGAVTADKWVGPETWSSLNMFEQTAWTAIRNGQIISNTGREMGGVAGGIINYVGGPAMALGTIDAAAGVGKNLVDAVGGTIQALK